LAEQVSGAWHQVSGDDQHRFPWHLTPDTCSLLFERCGVVRI